MTLSPEPTIIAQGGLSLMKEMAAHLNNGAVPAQVIAPEECKPNS